MFTDTKNTAGNFLLCFFIRWVLKKISTLFDIFYAKMRKYGGKMVKNVEYEVQK